MVINMNILMVLNNLRVANGVATTIMNQYDELIHNGFNVDFMEFLDFDSPYIDRIKKNGGEIFCVSKNKNALKNMSNILKRKNYNIVHINQVNAQTVQLAIIARYYQVPHVVFHSHNTKIPGGVKRRVLETGCNIVYRMFADTLVACSEQAGKDSFGNKDFVVLKNSIDARKFEFNKTKRDEIRTQLNISADTLVVGTVCRYARQKNPIFMIDIIDKLLNMGINTKFLWVGSAPSENDPVYKEMQKEIRRRNIADKMLWVGSKNDIFNWYSAMDVFLMPSLWEGLGITYIEAQANSLPTFASDVVPVETKVTELIKFYSLNLSADEWALEISKCSIRNGNVKNYFNEIKKAGYDLTTAKSDLLHIYQKVLN